MGDSLLGRTLGGKFTLESLIGTGAMGAVYRARHVALDAVVAVKVMHDDIAVDQTFAERFHREARAASRLDHPNVIRVIDFGVEPDGHLYIVMEYVEGYDLFQVIRRDSPLSEERIVDLLAQALSGIAAAHDMGVVHRDLKPENIMVATRVGDDGMAHEVVKVCDFGIAQLSEPERPETAPRTPQRTLTARGVLLGTPQYMSPEQARGEVTDARTDVYSLGVILYQLLSGELPFDAATPIDIVLKHISEEPVPPTALVPSASQRLEAVCMKALAKRREARWASAREMRAALRTDRAFTPRGTGTLASRDVKVATPTATTSPPGFDATLPDSPEKEPAPNFRRWSNRTALYAAAASGVVLLLGASVFVAGKDGGPRAAEAEPAVASTAKAATPSLAGPATEPATTASGEPASTAAPPRTSKNAGLRRSAAKSVGATEGVQKDDKGVARAPAEPAHDEAVAATPPAVAQPEPAPAQHAPARVAPSATTAERAVAETQATPFAVRSSALRVKWHVAQVGGGATSGDVTRSLSRAAASWNGCYESGLRSRGRRVEGQGTLRLSCDDQGRVVTATLGGTGMSDVAACVQNSVEGIRIPNADTGEAWATVAVTLAISD